MSRKQQNQLARNLQRDELKEEAARLMKQVESLTTANTVLRADADKAERYRQEMIRREVDNEYLEARNQTLRHELSVLERQLEAADRRSKAYADLHENAKQGLQNKMRYQMGIRDQLEAAAKTLTVLPDHYDTHTECYSDRDLIAALVKQLDYERGLKQHWEDRWHILWDAFEKLCKQSAALMSAASDVYDLCFEDDRDPHVRRLRRVLKIMGAFITRKEEPSNHAQKST